jgi:hypothetical protein
MADIISITTNARPGRQAEDMSDLEFAATLASLTDAQFARFVAKLSAEGLYDLKAPIGQGGRVS